MRRHFCRFALSSLLVASSIAFLAAAEPQIVHEWHFDMAGNVEGWRGFNHLKDVNTTNGILQGIVTGTNPFFVSPPLDMKTGRWQVIEFRLRTDIGGTGRCFFTETNEGQYGGFSEAKKLTWNLIGDGRWHEYRIYPFWNGLDKIVKFRIDVGSPAPEDYHVKKVEFDWIRVIDLGNEIKATNTLDWKFATKNAPFEAAEGAVVQPVTGGWRVAAGPSGTGLLLSRPFQCDIDDCGYWVCVELADCPTGGRAAVRFATDQGGFTTKSFELDGPGIYNISMLEQPEWSGKLQMIGLSPGTQPNAQITVKRLWVNENPQGPAKLKIDTHNSGLVDAVNRAGHALPVEILVSNTGGQTAKVEADLRILGIKSTVATHGSCDVPPGEITTIPLQFMVEKPVETEAALILKEAGTGKTLTEAALPIKVGASLGLPKASYVPEPKPVATDYEIGAYYYPGWEHRRAWDRVKPTAPIRKPMLGWYDEANPECVDWQIKWAAENGISVFFMDWYWNRGHRHHEHWIAAFQKARHKKYLKWCVMWANHNGADSHSEADQEAVVKFWIDNYFKTPEYYTIDGRPVAIIWSPKAMDEDIIAIEKKKGNELTKGQGVKRLIDLSQRIAKQAGFEKGIYFIAMKFPEGATRPEDIQWLADAGFEMTSIYHFMEHGGKAKDARRFSFDLVAEASQPWWTARRKTGILPFLPNIATGWDARPWHGEKTVVISGRSVPLFRKICEDAKRFADENNVKRLALAPLNEWGEGSYIEPNREFGFGMYETVREVFAKKPAAGWPLNFAPSDVGLGPYDLPETKREYRTSWDFNDGPQGWVGLMGVTGVKAENGNLTLTSTTHDPAINVTLNRIAAADFSRLVVRMKLTPSVRKQQAQLFWTTASSPTSEQRSVKATLAEDGEFHDYTFELSKNPLWKGRITSFRFDPLGLTDINVEIDSMRLEK